MNIVELKRQKISELAKLAKDLKIEGAASMRKQVFIFALLQAQIEKDGLVIRQPGRHPYQPVGGSQGVGDMAGVRGHAVADRETGDRRPLGQDPPEVAVAHGRRRKIQAGVRPGQKEGPLRARADEACLGFD